MLFNTNHSAPLANNQIEMLSDLIYTKADGKLDFDQFLDSFDPIDSKNTNS